jgi:hypothetical protein
MEVNGYLSHPSRFNPGERLSGNHWMEGWMGPRASLNTVEKREISLKNTVLEIIFVTKREEARE